MALKTKLQLRHDTIEKWESSDTVLLSGEIAFAYKPDGSVEMRVGDGEHTWSNLSASPIKWSAEQIEGLTESMSQLSTTHYEVDSLEQLSGDYVNGDTAVVKTKIGVDALSNDILSYTAYIYDSKVSNWKAMDGNYNANNVYFKDDIVTAGSWEKVGNLSHTKNTVGSLDVSSKSLTEVMDMIFKGEEGYPTKPTPSCGITQTAKTLEIGTTVTPAFTLSFDKKTYAYGSNTEPALGSTTGVSAKTYTLTYTDKDNVTHTLTGNYATSVTATTSYDVKAGTNNGRANLSVSYDAAEDGTYIPKSNLERVLSSETELATYRVSSGTAITHNDNNKIVGYYPNFYGFRGGESGTVMDTATVDSEFIRGLTAQTSSPNASSGKITPSSSLTASKTWRQCIYAIPTGLKSSLTAKDANNLPVGFTKMDKTVTITHINGVTSEYDVWYSQADSDCSPIKLTLTWA